MAIKPGRQAEHCETGTMVRVGQRRFDVAIAGEINLDLILYGLPETMHTERELLASGFAMTLGGSSAITAHNLAVLGAKVGFVTRTGADAMGRIAIERMVESGVDVLDTGSGDSGPGTGVTILLPHDGERHILTYPGVMMDMRCDDLPLEYLSDARHFHLSSLFLQRGLHAGLPDLLRTLRARGVSISMDTNDDPEDRWDGILEEILGLVDVLLPSEREVLRIAHADTLDAALDRLRDRVELLVVKCGARGAMVQDAHGRRLVPGVRVEPVDTIGAGDSFNAGFLHAWLRGADPDEAARVGTVTGALSTLATGGTEAWRDVELRERFFVAHGVGTRG